MEEASPPQTRRSSRSSRSSRRPTFFHYAATISVCTFPVAFILNVLFLFLFANLPGARLVGSSLTGLMTLAGMAVGVVALFGIPAHGTKGILVKALCGILIPLFFIVLGLAVLLFTLSKGDPQHKDIAPDAQFALIAERLSQQPPRMIDADTRLNRIELLPDNTLLFDYSIVTKTKAKYPPENLKKIRADLMQDYRSTPDMKIFRDNKVTVLVRYKDSVGEVIGEFTVGPDDF